MNRTTFRNACAVTCLILVVAGAVMAIVRHQSGPSLEIEFLGTVADEENRSKALLRLCNPGNRIARYEGLAEDFPYFVYQCRGEHGQFREFGPLAVCDLSTFQFSLEPGQSRDVEAFVPRDIHRFILSYTEAEFGENLLAKLPYRIRKHLPKPRERNAMSPVITISKTSVFNQEGGSF